MAMSILRVNENALTLDDKPFYLACGDIQYFRIYPDEWKRRLQMMKNFGLTAIQTYCPWNLHEPTPGEYDFSGLLDLRRFLETAAEVGLYVLLRPSPYICGEWEFGGLPWWLLKDRSTQPRCADPAYMQAVSRYYQRLCREFVPYLSTNGGPILAVSVENEYGSFGNDLSYLSFLRDELCKNGVDVPLYLTDCTRQGLTFTRPLGLWMGVNYRIESEEAIPMLREIQPGKPAFVGEYWSGHACYWGASGKRRAVAPIAAAYRKALELGASVSFYMFCGGTNFGFMNGTRVLAVSKDEPDRKIFRAITTSYDTDALISEDGSATEKYYACRRELDAYLGKPVRQATEPAPPVQVPSPVQLKQQASLFGNIEQLCGKTIHSAAPLTFEQLDCPYGFVLYSAVLPGGLPAPARLVLQQVRDRALIFANGRHVATVQRDFEAPEILLDAAEPVRLEILVENLGRTNTRPQFVEEKGLTGEVTWCGTRVFGWQNTTLPMSDFSCLQFDGVQDGKSAFFRGTFSAEQGKAAHLDMNGWKKGFAVVNGFVLGRFWDIGPQRTLYVPGGLLKNGENEILIFELYPDGMDTISFCDHAILDAPFREAVL